MSNHVRGGHILVPVRINAIGIGIGAMPCPQCHLLVGDELLMRHLRQHETSQRITERDEESWVAVQERERPVLRRRMVGH